ncbi:MAG: tetratricopeptide repeat protein, partial [Oscillatoriales cyanobacterium]
MGRQMATSTNFQQDYQRAEAAYTAGDYPEAAALVCQLVADFPEDPSARLLCGHIYCYGLEDYEVAREQYAVVLDLSDDQSLVEHAHNGINYTDQFLPGELPSENFDAETELEFYPDKSLDVGLENPNFELFSGDAGGMDWENPSPNGMENEDLADLGMSALGWEPKDDNEIGAADLTLASNPFMNDSGGMAAYAEATGPLDEEFASSDFGDAFALEEHEGLDDAFEDSKVSGKSVPYEPDSFSEAPTQILNGRGFAAPEVDNDIDLNPVNYPTSPSHNFDESFVPRSLPDEFDLDDDLDDFSSSPPIGQNHNYDIGEDADPFAQELQGEFGLPQTNGEYSSNYALAEDETLLMGGAVPNSQSPRG